MILVLCQNKKCTLTTFCITNKNKWNVFHFCHISRNNIHSLTYWFNPVASHEEYKRIKCSAMTSPLVGWKGSRPKMLKLQTVILLSYLIILTRSRHGFFHSFAGSPRAWGSGNQRHENDETLNGGIYYNVLQNFRQFINIRDKSWSIMFPVHPKYITRPGVWHRWPDLWFFLLPQESCLQEYGKTRYERQYGKIRGEITSCRYWVSKCPAVCWTLLYWSLWGPLFRDGRVGIFPGLWLQGN